MEPGRAIDTVYCRPVFPSSLLPPEAWVFEDDSSPFAASSASPLSFVDVGGGVTDASSSFSLLGPSPRSSPVSFVILSFRFFSVFVFFIIFFFPVLGVSSGLTAISAVGGFAAIAPTSIL